MMDPDSTTAAVYLLASIPLLLFLSSLFGKHSLRHIPTVGGPSFPVLSYIGVYNFVHNGRKLLQEGYDKYKGGMFKLPMPGRWLVVVTGPKLVDELHKFPDDHVSLLEGIDELIGTKEMFGHSLHSNPYHVAVVRQQLTRHLGTVFPDIRDEIVAAFGDNIPARSDGWVEVPAFRTMRQIIARVSNRVFLGLPYCRNTAYLQLVTSLTADVSKGRKIIPLLPQLLKPLAAKVITDINQRIDTCSEYLHGLIHDRVQDMEKFGDDWADRPNDLLQWLIDEEKRAGGRTDVRDIVRRILSTNFAAIHTSSASFIHALYHLAANPEYLIPLREEIDTVLQEEGWTKAAMSNMRKLDSFMMESQRYNGVNGISVIRKALKDLTFSDGTFIPADTILAAAATPTHMDPANYADPHIFDPWRFSNTREESTGVWNRQYVSTSVDYMSFGLGKHACPGRFFAANELKAMLAHVIVNYDVKFKDEGEASLNEEYAHYRNFRVLLWRKAVAMCACNKDNFCAPVTSEYESEEDVVAMADSDISIIAVYLLASIPLVLFFGSLFSIHNLRYIPTVGGSSLPLLSYLGVYNYLHNGRKILQEGYDKYKGGMFKIPTLARWIVVVTGPRLVDEMHKFSDEYVSFLEGAGDLIGTRYMFGEGFHENPYHVTVIRGQLTRQLVTAFPDIRDEITAAFGEHIPAHTDAWLSVPALPIMRQIVARVSNRVFLGLPYCRNQAYLDLAINFTVDVGKGRSVIPLFPVFLRGLAAKFITNIERRIDTCRGYLQDLIQGRLQDMDKFGNDWADKPNDMLQWLIDEEKKSGTIDVRNVVRMVLAVNFAAIHTSSNSFTHALYHLAANPEFIASLREEVEGILQEEGWTKAAMGKMRKLDSFMRESQRMNGINGISVMRKAMQDLKFSDGTFIPAGTLMVAAATAIHMDEENYMDPDVFNPWRFSDMREEDGSALKHQFVNTSLDYVSFGHGKHACPGRFFAANELKAMMAHVVVNYDVKFKHEGVRPQNKWLALTVVPDPTAEVLFRKHRG
ncbi:hypothetical protein NM688_g5847 [Phlebia brevispora]|uniref:Uncharacterized protein n=1 Tax=Phlebia brevispora TaxID=194682 RepID=A0ACC1SNW7_9APHY|nr:hypothetical protein NM688_g5847 [Phlebia brevispora]